MEQYAPPKQGSTLGINERFLRLWYEIVENKRKWMPCLKGGEYRKWYGNHNYYVNWEHNGKEVRKTGKATIRNSDKLFCEGISWSRITTHPSFRIMLDGFFLKVHLVCVFPKRKIFYLHWGC